MEAVPFNRSAKDVSITFKAYPLRSTDTGLAAADMNGRRGYCSVWAINNAYRP